MNTIRLMIGSTSGRRWRATEFAVAGAAVIAVAASILAAPGVGGILGAGLAVLMLAIAIIDARHFIIPDVLNAAGITLALASAAASDDMVGPAVGWALVRGLTLALVFLGIRVAYRHLRGREGIGLGDVKLAGVAGAWLDWLTMPVAVEIAAISALTIYLTGHVISGRKIRRTTRLPFGLFFAPAIWLAWLIETMWLARFQGFWS